MKLTLDINIDQLIQILKYLPEDQLAEILRIKKDIKAKDKNDEKENFHDFILNGPVMSDEQYQEFLDNRKRFKQWRTR